MTDIHDAGGDDPPLVPMVIGHLAQAFTAIGNHGFCRICKRLRQT